MNDGNGAQPDTAREQLLYRYFCALERGNLDAMEAILKEAEDDPLMETLLPELVEALFEEELSMSVSELDGRWDADPIGDTEDAQISPRQRLSGLLTSIESEEQRLSERMCPFAVRPITSARVGVPISQPASVPIPVLRASDRIASACCRPIRPRQDRSR